MVTESPSRFDQLFTLDEVCERVSLSRSTVLREIDRGRFPAGLKVAPKAVRWRESTLAQWENEREEEATNGEVKP